MPLAVGGVGGVAMGRRKRSGSVRAGALPVLRKLIREVVQGPPAG